MNFIGKMLGLKKRDPQKPEVPFNEEVPLNEEAPTYLAIDFETANASRLSACALGLAWLQNGNITRSKSYLIKPPTGHRFNPIHIGLHGIRSEDVRHSKSFGELWHAELGDLFNAHHLLLHNASMDVAVLRACFEHYGIENYRFQYTDTLKAARKFGLPGRLSDLCESYGIFFMNNHDAEQDAVSCARVFAGMVRDGKDVHLVSEVLSHELTSRAAEQATRANLDKLTEFNTNISTIARYSAKGDSPVEIEGKTFVLTGALKHEREYYREKIEKMGGFVKSAVSGKTNYVVTGYEFSPSKIAKVKEINETKGKHIQMLTPDRFYSAIN